VRYAAASTAPGLCRTQHAAACWPRVLLLSSSCLVAAWLDVLLAGGMQRSTPGQGFLDMLRADAELPLLGGTGGLDRLPPGLATPQLFAFLVG